MKRIYTLMTAALLIAGTALWSGCDNNELQDDASGNVTSQEVKNFSFNIKGLGAQTRVTTEEGIELENTVKTMYVAFFLKDNADEKTSKLHKIYCDDDAAVADWNDLKITESGGNYSIGKVGTVGDYIVYFIANPDKTIKDDLLTMQQAVGDARATLATFESTLVTHDGTADGKTDDEGAAQTEEGSQRGFIMLSKENVTLSDNTTISVALTRLAARFDFINSAATTTDNEVTITKIEFSNSGKNSLVAETADLTATTRLENKTYDNLSTNWTDQVGEENKFTAYAYENLITESAVNRTMITVYYTLGKSGGDRENKKLNIDLKEDDDYIGVTRNHLYRIYLNGVSGQFKLTVADWNDGNTVKVPNEDLAVVYTATDLGKIGDFVYNSDGELKFSDGGLRRINLDGTLTWDENVSNIKFNSANGTCIGIVFSTVTSEQDKADKYERGYFVGLKTLAEATSKSWKRSNTDDGMTKMNTPTLAFNNLDGRTENAICKLTPDVYTMYNAFMTNYNKLDILPTGTSEWYIPSTGQWCLIANNLGGLGLTGINYLVSADSQSFANKLTSKFKAAGSSITFHRNEGWTSSTEFSATENFRFVIYTDNTIGVNPLEKTQIYRIALYVAAF